MLVRVESGSARVYASGRTKSPVQRASCRPLDASQDERLLCTRQRRATRRSEKEPPVHSKEPPMPELEKILRLPIPFLLQSGRPLIRLWVSLESGISVEASRGAPLAAVTQGTLREDDTSELSRPVDQSRLHDSGRPIPAKVFLFSFNLFSTRPRRAYIKSM